MIGDLRVIGPNAVIKRNIAAGGTAISTGEPLQAAITSSSGVASANVMALAAADFPVVSSGNYRFGGIAIKNSLNVAAGTTKAQLIPCACPVPFIGKIRAKAETKASIDTAAELLAIIGDYVLIDYNSTGGSDGGELYTIKETASADTSGLEIVGGNISRGTLDVVCDGDIYRFDRS